MPLTTTLAARIKAQSLTTIDQGTSRDDVILDASVSLASGTATNQADLLFSDQRTIAASSSETLDLNALTDARGATVNMARVVTILIKASSSNTNDVVIGNAASNPFVGPLGGTTPTITLKPGAFVMLGHPVGTTNWASTNGASDQLKIANSGAGSSITYDILIIGKSA